MGCTYLESSSHLLDLLKEIYELEQARKKAAGAEAPGSFEYLEEKDEN
jgi:hypothetical protein